MIETSLMPLLHTMHAAIAWIAGATISHCLTGRTAGFSIYFVVCLGIAKISTLLH